MTDNEIKKALECCQGYHECSKCPFNSGAAGTSECISECMSEALDLINRLQAENEAFAKIITKQDDEISGLRKELLSRKNLEESFSKSVKQFEKKLARTVELTKAEAYKEMADILTAKFIHIFRLDYGNEIFLKRIVAITLQEMSGSK